MTEPPEIPVRSSIRAGLAASITFGALPFTLGAVLLALGAVTAAGLGGCQAIALWHEDQPIPAQYDKLTKSPLLVLVEDTPNSTGDATIRYPLLKQLAEHLRNQKVNMQVIPDREVRDFLNTHPRSAAWEPARLGRELHAQQVLFVQMEPYASNTDMVDPNTVGRLTATVRVIDAEDGALLWPMRGEGHKVTYKLRVPDLHGSAPGYEQKTQLAQGLADQIAKLFYDHQPTEGETVRLEAEEHGLQ